MKETIADVSSASPSSERRQFVYIFVGIFYIDLGKTRIDFRGVGATDYKNVSVKIFNCSVNVKTKDCAQSRPFQHKLQHQLTAICRLN